MNRVPQMLNLFLLFTLCNTVEVNATESANQVEYRRHVEKVWLHLIRQDLVLSNFSLAAPDLSNTNEFDTTSENPVQTNGDLFYVPETSKHPWPNSSEVANTLNADDRLVETDDKESYPCAANTCSSFVHRIQSSVVKEFKNVLLDDHLRSTGQKATLYAPHLPYVKPNLTELGEANVSMLEKLFASASLNNIRNHEHNQPLKEKAVKSITGQLSSYALEMYNQEFTFKAPNGSQVTGVNVIAVIPGRRRHQPGDRILLIGAHYDTVKNSVGVDDNGSGVAALIELSRLCSSHIGKFNSTIYFVAFDMQEHGILGSLAFVNQYLIPEEIAGKKAKFTGAYIMDMVMNFDSRPRSQSLPLDIFTAVPDASSWVRLNDFKGDFLSVWSRKIIDWHLWHSFYLSWKEFENSTGVENNIKLMSIDPPIPRTPLLISNWRYRNFMKSDHAAFWHHKNRAYSQSLNAVLLTDMGPWRGKQSICYHDFCDDKEFLTPANLLFLKRIVDVLAKTVALLGELY